MERDGHSHAAWARLRKSSVELRISRWPVIGVRVLSSAEIVLVLGLRGEEQEPDRQGYSALPHHPFEHTPMQAKHRRREAASLDVLRTWHL